MIIDSEKEDEFVDAEEDSFPELKKEDMLFKSNIDCNKKAYPSNKTNCTPLNTKFTSHTYTNCQTNLKTTIPSRINPGLNKGICNSHQLPTQLKFNIANKNILKKNDFLNLFDGVKKKEIQRQKNMPSVIFI